MSMSVYISSPDVYKPSSVMPTRRHFANRQNLQLVLFADEISQLSPFAQMNFLCSCSFSIRRKNPWFRNHNPADTLTVVTLLSHRRWSYSVANKTSDGCGLVTKHCTRPCNTYEWDCSQ